MKTGSVLGWLTWRAYATCMTLATPLWHAVLRRRLARGKESPASLAQKIMQHPAPRPSQPVVWGHAVGVGEARALAGLFTQLAAALPGVHFLLTTQSVGAQAALGSNDLPHASTVQAAPLDTPATVQAFLRHWQPALALWCELDLWPNLVMGTAMRGVPMWLVNARLYPQSLHKRRWARALYGHMLGQFAAVYAQNVSTREGLLALGAPPARTHLGGNLKALAPPPGADPHRLGAWQQALGGRPLWLMVSAHEGEFALAAKAHAALLVSHPQALLLLMPRFPSQATSAQRALQLCGVAATLSQSVPPHAVAQQQALIIDAWGEVGLWGRLTRVAAVGGSWVNLGGHNPYEPLALGCHLLHGPHVHNFAEDYAALLPTQHSQCVNTAAELAHAVAATWTAPSTAPTWVAAAGPAQAMLQALQQAAINATRRPASRPV